MMATRPGIRTMLLVDVNHDSNIVAENSAKKLKMPF